MKVFISMPMHNISIDTILENAKKLKKVAEGYCMTEDEEVKTICGIDAPIPDNDVKNERVFYLGNGIQLLSTCDAILAPSSYTNGWWDEETERPRFIGCEIEKQVAQAYGIQMYVYDIDMLKTKVND